jgi:diacylglycerol O-acyltransferase
LKQLGYTDAIFLSLETPSTPQHVGSLSIYDPSSADDGFRFEDIMTSYARRLSTLPHFRTRLVRVPGALDRPYWMLDENFDAEYHIRRQVLPQPGDWGQLCHSASRLHATPLDLARPLWECVIIEGIDQLEGLPPGCFAIYIKFHHAMADGDLGQRIMDALHDPEPDAGGEPLAERADERLASFTRNFKESVPGDLELLGRAASRRLREALPFARKAGAMAADLGQTILGMARRELPLPAMGPRTRFDAPVGPHRAIDATVFSLAEMKALKEQTGTTLNDMCVAVVSGGMRRYLSHHGELPAQSLVANMPVNMRERGLVSDENNQIAALMARIHTEIADPLERLAAIHDDIDGARKLIGTPLSEPLKVVGLLPTSLAGPLARAYARGGWTRLLPIGTPCVISNVPGPQRDLFVSGARLVSMHGIGLLTPGVALFHGILSHGDNVTLTVLCDPDIMTDSAFYRQCLEAAYTELKTAILG